MQDHTSQDQCLQDHQNTPFQDHAAETPEKSTTQAIIEN